HRATEPCNEIPPSIHRAYRYTLKSTAARDAWEPSFGAGGRLWPFLSSTALIRHGSSLGLSCRSELTGRGGQLGGNQGVGFGSPPLVSAQTIVHRRGNA